MKIIALLFLIPISAFAIEPMDNYYADDLLDAVDQAKASPHHYDYSNNFRYKRTTAQSINLNRLNLKELDETRLKTNDKNDPDNTIMQLAETNDNISTSQTPKEINQKSINIPQASLSRSSYYSSDQGEFNSTGIHSNSIITTTPRP